MNFSDLNTLAWAIAIVLIAWEISGLLNAYAQRVLSQASLIDDIGTTERTRGLLLDLAVQRGDMLLEQEREAFEAEQEREADVKNLFDKLREAIETNKVQVAELTPADETHISDTPVKTEGPLGAEAGAAVAA